MTRICWLYTKRKGFGQECLGSTAKLCNVAVAGHNRLPLRHMQLTGRAVRTYSAVRGTRSHLHLDQLLVHEAAAVVQQLHREFAGAAVTCGRFIYPSAVACHHRLVAAGLALEHRQPVEALSVGSCNSSMRRMQHHVCRLA